MAFSFPVLNCDCYMTRSIQKRQSAFLRGAWLYFAVVMLAYAVVILTAAAPSPFIDFPDWVYQGVLFHHVLVGHPVAGYVLKHYPVPNSTTTVALGMLDLVLPWVWAAKLWACFYLALAGFSSWMLARALDIDDWRLVVVLPGVVFLNLNFWLGQISIEIGICLLMLLLAMLLREVGTGWIAAMLVLLFFTHMEACAAGVLLFALWCGFDGRWRRLWAAAPAAGLTVWYAIVRFMKGNADGEALRPNLVYGSPEFIVFKVNTYFKTFGYVNACAPDKLSKTEAIFGRDLFLLMIVGAFFITVFCLMLMIRFAVLRLSDRRQRYLGIFVLVLLLISSVLHQTMLGTSDPGARLMLMAAAVGLFLIDWRSRPGTALAVLSVFFCLMNLWQFARIDQNPLMPGHPKDVPAAALRFSHADTEARLVCYTSLRSGKMDVQVFPTGIFINEQR